MRGCRISLSSTDVCDHTECQCVRWDKCQFKSNHLALSEWKLRFITERHRTAEVAPSCFLPTSSQTSEWVFIQNSSYVLSHTAKGFGLWIRIHTGATFCRDILDISSILSSLAV